MHVRGFTQAASAKCRRSYRGTYAALATAPVISYLKRLGVTAVELMPVHFFVHDRHLVEKGLRNYWGYNSIGYFAPHQDYAASRAVRARVQDHGARRCTRPASR